MLTSIEIDAMRTMLNASLPDTAQVQRKTLTSDGAGGFTEAWTTVATVACRVAPSGQSPQERAIAERLASTSIWTLTVPALTGWLWGGAHSRWQRYWRAVTKSPAAWCVWRWCDGEYGCDTAGI